MDVSTVSTHFPVPEASTDLKEALTRIHELGTSSSFFDRHGKAVGKAVVAIAISVFDTAAYTGKALGGFCIAFIDLSFLESVELLAENGADALRSLCMVVILIGSVVSGFFIPVTVFGSFPSYPPNVPRPLPVVAPVVQQNATVDQAQIELLLQQKQELEGQVAALRQTLTTDGIKSTSLKEKIGQQEQVLQKVKSALESGMQQIAKLKVDIAALELQKQQALQAAATS